MNTANTAPSGTRQSEVQHESVPIPREVSQALGRLSIETRTPKSAMWRKWMKQGLAIEDPKLFMELAGKGLLSIGLIFTTLFQLGIGEFDQARVRNNRRGSNTVRVIRTGGRREMEVAA